ncbi:hypothetical protein [Polaribacter marinivivus]|uniref:Uncharacterized protein n=1 Tax=Polaribacter marinivivus TaxID=1524260 RepID=A0ABV8R846_9FLAO
MKNKYQRIILCLSIGLYLISLPQKSFCTVGNTCEYFSGLLHLIFGWFGVFKLHLPAFPWLANPLLFFSWLFLFVKKTKIALVLSGIAFLLMISFLLVDEIIVNDGSTTSIVNFYGFGYWLWVLSSAIILFGYLFLYKKK